MLPLVFAAAAFSAPESIHADSWISPAIDFPRSGVPKDTLVMNAIEVTVNRYGRPEGCRVYASIGNPKMAPYTCRLIQLRAMFKPARDESGRRAYGVYRNRLYWYLSDKRELPKVERAGDFQVPIDHAPPGEAKLPFHELIEFVVDENGQVRDCKGAGDWKDPSFASIACKQLPTRFSIAPARTRQGKAVASVQLATVEFVQRALPK
jgi:hypothetical protein